MAKKKKTSRKKAPIKSAPKHDLPSGFWPQVGAILLIAISLLFVVAWFNAGGPVLNWIYETTLSIVGYSVYIIPMLFMYIAIEIFKSEDNKLSVVIKFATATAILWFSALFGLLQTGGGIKTGGYIGDAINQFMLALVNPGIAAFIYILLIIITLLFILRISPFTVIHKLWELGRRDMSDQEANVKVMRNAAAVDGANLGSMGNFKTVASVPTVSGNDGDKKTSRLPNVTKSTKNHDDKSALVTVSDPDWKAPSLDLLEKKQSPADAGDVQGNARTIQETLSEFEIEVDMKAANIGPRVTQFTLQPTSGIKLSRITALEDNLALNLGAPSLRIEAPIPGQKAVGIEVPNQKGADVRLYSILSSPEWKKKTEPLTFAIGQDISGKVVLGELSDMPHLLIAGQTKAGKSVMINTLLTSLLYHNSPSDLKLILIDPKRVEMTSYEDIPHLLTPIITEPEKTISALKWCVHEMDKRYALLAENKVKTIQDYNSKIRTKGQKVSIEDKDGIAQDHENVAMPYIVIVIDELSDLKAAAPKDMEGLIIRLAQKGRAAGVHLVLATQSPRKDVITGLIKANVPAKIAFSVSNQMESRIILDHNGAEKLLGHGDMLLSTTSMSKMQRVQGAWVTDAEVHKVMDHLRMQSQPQYNDDVVSQPVHLNGKGGVVMDYDNNSDDKLYNDAVRIVTESGKASASYLQRRLSIGYSRAAKLIDSMEGQGIVGPANGSKPRDILVDNVDGTNQAEDEYYDEL